VSAQAAAQRHATDALLRSAARREVSLAFMASFICALTASTMDAEAHSGARAWKQRCARTAVGHKSPPGLGGVAACSGLKRLHQLAYARTHAHRRAWLRRISRAAAVACGGGARRGAAACVWRSAARQHAAAAARAGRRARNMAMRGRRVYRLAVDGHKPTTMMMSQHSPLRRARVSAARTARMACTLQLHAAAPVAPRASARQPAERAVASCVPAARPRSSARLQLAGAPLAVRAAVRPAGRGAGLATRASAVEGKVSNVIDVRARVLRPRPRPAARRANARARSQHGGSGAAAAFAGPIAAPGAACWPWRRTASSDVCAPAHTRCRRSQVDSEEAFDALVKDTPADKLLVVECSATWCVQRSPRYRG
jgi:hypothetical protein